MTRCGKARTQQELEQLCATLEKRIDRADHIILTLTMDHNSSPNYVRGFDMAREYFSDVNAAPCSTRAA